MKAYGGTHVTEGETKGDIVRIVAKYNGKLESIIDNVPGRAIITILSNHMPPRRLRIVLLVPVGTGNEIEQDRRTKWRSLYYYIKACLVAVDVGIMVYEQAFMAWIVGPNNKTLYETAQETRLLPPSHNERGFSDGR